MFHFIQIDNQLGFMIEFLLMNYIVELKNVPI